jgi:3-isopropylmalate/(R)-2-methylmalate dehydratase large subunit
LSRNQVQQLQKIVQKHIELFGLGHQYQGIVHIIAPELGITQPGMSIVCGDSHTSTHGALELLLSESEQVRWHRFLQANVVAE